MYPHKFRMYIKIYLQGRYIKSLFTQHWFSVMLSWTWDIVRLSIFFLLLVIWFILIPLPKIMVSKVRPPTWMKGLVCSSLPPACSFARTGLATCKLSLDLWIHFHLLIKITLHKHFCYSRLFGKVLLWLSCQMNYLLFHGISFLFKRMTDKNIWEKGQGEPVTSNISCQ